MSAAAISPPGTWTITVNSVNPDAWSVVEAENMFNTAPPSGDVDYMVNLTVTWNGSSPTEITDLGAFLSSVGASGIAYGISQECGVLPSPREIDYSDIFPGATFGLNECWQVSQSDAPSLEMFWSGATAPGPFWSLH